MPAAFPALTYLDPAQLAAADQVDISILARDPRSIDTSAPEMAKERRSDVTSGPDGQPAESIVYNENLLPWLGASGRTNYVGSFLLTLAVSIALIVCGSALVIYNAFAISIGERKKQFGMFASVGATAAQIRRIVLTEAGVIAAIGIPLGILGAIAGVGILLRLTQGIVSQLILDATQGMPLVVSPLVIGADCAVLRGDHPALRLDPRPARLPGFAHRCHPPERRDPGGQAAQPRDQPADPAYIRVRGRAGAQIPPTRP